MDPRTYAPAVANRGLLTNRQALAAGLSAEDIARLVRHGTLVRVRRGIYVSAEQWEEADPFRERPLLRIRAAHLALQVPHVFSHDSAAIALGLGAPDPRTSLVHITRERVHGGRRISGIQHHGAPFHPDQVVWVDGLPVLDAARTALDMVREHGLRGGLPVCDRVLHAGVPRPRLVLAAEAMRSWPHRRTIGEALRLADGGAESWLESLGRLLVLETGIGIPETQFGLSDGTMTVRCDFRVGRHVFEVDGRVKYGEGNVTGLTTQEVLWREKQRQDFITGFKLGISRLTQHDLYAGWEAGKRRVLREYAETVRRYGTDIADLAAYVRRCSPTTDLRAAP